MTSSRVPFWCSIIFLLLLHPTQACLWTYEADLQGRIHMVNKHSPEHYADGLLETVDTDVWQAQAERLRESDPADFEARNDLAVALIRTGQTEEALPILLQIEEAHPGKYETASNLGTAYELLGEVDKAHSWIEEGIKRNPKSHYGSEWVHLEILKTKQRLRQQPDWLKSNRILPDDADTPQEVGSRAADLEYQLHERLSLVEPPDPIVAALLFELGDMQGRLGSAERAAQVYRLALRYQPANEEQVKERLAEAQEALDSRRWLVSLLNEYGHPVQVVMVGGGFVLFVLIGVLIWRRSRKSLESSSREQIEE